MIDDVLTRNSNGELEVRVVQATEKATAPSNYDDVFTVTTDGKRAMRVVGGGGGAGGPVNATQVSMTPVDGINATNVQGGMELIAEALKVKPQNIAFKKLPDFPEGPSYGAVLNLGKLEEGEYTFYSKIVWDKPSEPVSSTLGAESIFSVYIKIAKNEAVRITYMPRPDLVGDSGGFNQYATTDIAAMPQNFHYDGVNDFIVTSNPGYPGVLATSSFGVSSIEISDLFNITKGIQTEIIFDRWESTPPSDAESFTGTNPYSVSIPSNTYFTARSYLTYISTLEDQIFLLGLSALTPGEVTPTGDYALNTFPRIIRYTLGMDEALSPTNLLEFTAIFNRSSVRIIKHTATGVFKNVNFSIYRRVDEAYVVYMGMSNFGNIETTENIPVYFSMAILGSSYDVNNICPQTYSVNELPEPYIKIADIAPSPDLLALAPFLNADASTYILDSLSPMFQYSTAKLAKVYNENKLPTTGAYTVLSLGWTYNDNNNQPALLAVELSTGKFYYYFGTEENCKPSAWKEFNFGSGTGTSNNGIIGDYQSHYGIIDAPYGLPTQGTGNEIKMAAGLQLSVPGADNYITLSSAETYTLTSTTDCTLFYVRSESGGAATYMEATSVHYSEDEPEYNGITGFQAWKKPGENWQFRSNDTGNVWRSVVGTPLMDCKFSNGNLVRIDFIGYRLLNKQDLQGVKPFNPVGTTPVQITSEAQTATTGGWLVGYIRYGETLNTTCKIEINDTIVAYGSNTTGSNWAAVSISIYLAPGQSFKYSGDARIQENGLYYYPA